MRLFLIGADRRVIPTDDGENTQVVFCLRSYPEKLKLSLARTGVECIDPPLLSECDREEMLHDYVNAIGGISAVNARNKVWWASDMASKNRFISVVPELINDFIYCSSVIEQYKSEDIDLYIAGASWPVIVGVEAFARGQDIDVRIVAWPWAKKAKRCWEKVKIWMALTKSMMLSLYYVFKMRIAFSSSVQCVDNNRPICLIKSFVYPSCFGDDGTYCDPFYGVLPLKMQHEFGNEIQVVTISLGFSKKFDCYRKMQNTQDRVVVPLEAYIRFWDVVSGFFILCREKLVQPILIPQQILFLGFDLTSVFRESLASSGGSIQFSQYLHYFAAKRFIEQHQVLSCILTYEGNPWERMFILGLRSVDANLLVVGYQHSVVPQAAAGVFVSKLEMEVIPHPDRIVCTGVKTANILKRYSAFSDHLILSGCALRYRYLYGLDTLSRQRVDSAGFTVLVALEGVKDVTEMLSYAISQAGLLPEVRFLVRSHPVFPLQQLLKLLGKKRSDMPVNLLVSVAGEVAGDIVACDVVLYWGTTVAVEALMIGRPVIHYDRGDWLSYDPLFELEDFKWHVDRSSALGAVLHQIQQLSDADYSARCAAGQKYVREYLSEESDAAVTNFLPDKLQCAKVDLRDSNT